MGLDLRKYLGSVDENYTRDLLEIQDKPHDSFDMDLADAGEKSQVIKLYGLLASLIEGLSKSTSGCEVSGGVEQL